MKNKMVYVRWIDSSLTAEWCTAPSKSTGVSHIETLGYLIYEGKKHIEVAQSKSEYHKSAIMSIPKSVIRELKILKVKK